MTDFARRRLEAPAATGVAERCVAAVRAAIVGYERFISLHGLLDRHRLRRYGDRVSADLDERLRSMVSIDSSVFHLVLTGAPRIAARA